MTQESPGDSPTPPGSFTQEVQHSQVSARIPEKLSQGVYAGGVLILHGQNEFILDFLQQLVRPQRIVARVVMSPPGLFSFMEALEENFRKHENQFGPAKALPPPPVGAKPLPIDEIYSNLKIADEMLGGNYTNAAMITHNASDFSFDFLATFYPKSVLSARVFMSAQQIPVFLSVGKNALNQYQAKQKVSTQAEPPPSPAPPSSN